MQQPPVAEAARERLGEWVQIVRISLPAARTSIDLHHESRGKVREYVIVRIRAGDGPGNGISARVGASCFYNRQASTERSNMVGTGALTPWAD